MYVFCFNIARHNLSATLFVIQCMQGEELNKLIASVLILISIVLCKILCSSFFSIYYLPVYIQPKYISRIMYVFCFNIARHNLSATLFVIQCMQGEELNKLIASVLILISIVLCKILCSSFFLFTTCLFIYNQNIYHVLCMYSVST